MTQLLEGKRAVVFGAGGSLGAAVARELAAQGAVVFASGRTTATVEHVVDEVTRAGGTAHADTVDALDTAAVDRYVESVRQRVGGIDVVFNATGPRISEYANGKPALDLSIDEFMIPVNTVLRSQFLTARAAARIMSEQRSGVVIFLTGSPAKPHTPGASAIGAAFGALENLTRTLAIELAGTGVRVVCLRTAANPDSRTIQDTMVVLAKMLNISTDQAVAGLAQSTLLGQSPTTQDTATAAAYLASDWAQMLTGTVHNASAGVVTD